MGLCAKMENGYDPFGACMFNCTCAYSLQLPISSCKDSGKKVVTRGSKNVGKKQQK